ncbi:MAG: STAS domain-containing protein [Phycisphaerae bacterium]
MANEIPGLSIFPQRSGENFIVALRGEIDLQSSPRLREAMLAEVENGAKRFIFDLADVTYVDSSGVGTLVELKRKLERRGAKLILAKVQARVMNVLEITQLDKFFPITADTKTAESL